MTKRNRKLTMMNILLWQFEIGEWPSETKKREAVEPQTKKLEIIFLKLFS